MEINQQTIKKHLDFLIKMNQKCNDTNKFNPYTFGKENRMNTIVINVMKKGGIIETIGRGKKTITKWVTISPNQNMSIELIRRMNRYQKEAQNRAKKREEVYKNNLFTTVKEEKKKEIPSLSSGLLMEKTIKVFGLTIIKVNYKYN